MLDNELELCAQYHCDKHVVKMILESAQMLCTVLHQNGQDAPYKSTHEKHPCVIWAGESLDNWIWLKNLTEELNKEYQYRFEHSKSHRSAAVVRALTLPSIASKGITERPQAMPEEYKVPGDPVAAYRQFYLSEKHHLLHYTKRDKPWWVLQQDAAWMGNKRLYFDEDRVIKLYKMLSDRGIDIWLDGGWGVDALLGKQTRPHFDLDLIVEEKHVKRLRDLLKDIGFDQIERGDDSHWNFVLANKLGHLIDMHVIVFDENKNGAYGPAERGVFYPAEALLGQGDIGGFKVRCLTPEYQIASRSGYKLTNKDINDVDALCNRYNIPHPKIK